MKGKLDKLDLIKILFALQMTLLRGWKGKLQPERKYLQITYMHKGLVFRIYKELSSQYFKKKQLK